MSKLGCVTRKGNLVNFTGIRLYLNSLDPPVVIMLEDEMLPEKYENKEVLWIETEAKHKVWPYSNRSWKRIRRKFIFRHHKLWCFPVYNGWVSKEVRFH